MIIEGNEKEKAAWQNFIRATERKGFDYRRSLLQPFEKNIKRKITVRVKSMPLSWKL